VSALEASVDGSVDGSDHGTAAPCMLPDAVDERQPGANAVSLIAAHGVGVDTVAEANRAAMQAPADRTSGQPTDRAALHGGSPPVLLLRLPPIPATWLRGPLVGP